MVISLNSLQWHDIMVTFGEGYVHCFDILKGSDAVFFRLWKLFLISPDNFSQIYISVYMCAAQIWLEPLNELDRTVLRQVMEIKLSSLGIFEPKKLSITYEYNHHWLCIDFFSGDVNKESKVLSGILFVPGVLLMFMGLVVIGTTESGLGAMLSPWLIETVSVLTMTAWETLFKSPIS